MSLSEKIASELERAAEEIRRIGQSKNGVPGFLKQVRKDAKADLRHSWERFRDSVDDRLEDKEKSEESDTQEGNGPFGANSQAQNWQAQNRGWSGGNPGVVVPTYSKDVRTMMQDDFSGLAPILDSEMTGNLNDEAPKLFYDPTQEVGSFGPGPDKENVMFVSAPEYFSKLLEFRSNVSIVFLEAFHKLQENPSLLEEVDDKIAETFMGQYEGLLLSPRVRQLSEEAASLPGGDYWADLMELWKNNIMDAKTVGRAVELHTEARIEFLLEGVKGRLDDFQVAAGEFLVDYLLMQKGILEDVKLAEQNRKKGEARGERLDKMDRAANLIFETVVGVIHRPQVIAQAIPLENRDGILQFAQKRKQYSTQGLLGKYDVEG